MLGNLENIEPDFDSCDLENFVIVFYNSCVSYFAEYFCFYLKDIANANKVAMYSHMLYLYAYTYLFLSLVQKEMLWIYFWTMVTGVGIASVHQKVFLNNFRTCPVL